MTRVSFSLPDVGLRELRGMAHVEDGFLVLSLQDALLGFADTQKTTVKIAPEALADLRIERGIARDRLVIEPKGVELLETIPGNHRTAVRLRVSRRQRRDLEELVHDFERLLW
jgi:hypothetical protein